MRRRQTAGGRSTLLVGLLALTGGACTPLDDALASVPFLKFMRQTQSLQAYEDPRPAPPGAVPFESPGGQPEPPVEPTQASLLAFAESPYGRNPLAPGEALEQGHALFERYCMVCHGTDGQGNGPVVGQGKFPMGPTLVGATPAGHSDGYIYAVIKGGRSLMPEYGGRTTPDQRWAIVNYVRELQRAGGATPAAPDTTSAPDTATDTTTAAAPAVQPGDTAADTTSANDNS